jgi:hypothetical protein
LQLRIPALQYKQFAPLGIYPSARVILFGFNYGAQTWAMFSMRLRPPTRIYAFLAALLSVGMGHRLFYIYPGAKGSNRLSIYHRVEKFRRMEASKSAEML